MRNPTNNIFIDARSCVKAGKKICFKLVVNNLKCINLPSILSIFLEESFKYNMGLGPMLKFSFKISYRNQKGKLINIKILTRYNKENLEYDRILKDIIQEIRNRRIDPSLIERLHLHLYLGVNPLSYLLIAN